MRIGCPREIKADEYRVGLMPVGAEVLTRQGHQVLVETNAGLSSGFPDEAYLLAGAKIAKLPAEIFDFSDMIIKVKEPQPQEIGLFKPGQIVFTYFHFAASETLLRQCMESGIVAIAYETIQDAFGRLPCLIPMSEVAGKMSIQAGAKYLEKPMMGRGILLGGVPGVPPANVVILGAGTVDANAAKIAAGLGASVRIMDINLDRLRYLSDVMPANVQTIFSDPHTVAEQLRLADLVVGSVLIPGAKAPKLVQRSDLVAMKNGSVVVDVAIDQGGCMETSQPTTHAKPTYVVEGVVHYCVANMPGAVGRTSTIALCNATLPYAVKIARHGWQGAIEQDPGFKLGVNLAGGKITHPAVAKSFGMPCEGI